MRGWGDVGGVFVGRYGKLGYLVRLSKGELHLRGYRQEVVDPSNPMNLIQGKIIKRGRVTIINLLRNYRWIKNHQQKSMLLWGLRKYENGIPKGTC